MICHERTKKTARAPVTRRHADAVHREGGREGERERERDASLDLVRRLYSPGILLTLSLPIRLNSRHAEEHACCCQRWSHPHTSPASCQPRCARARRWSRREEEGQGAVRGRSCGVVCWMRRGKRLYAEASFCCLSTDRCHRSRRGGSTRTCGPPGVCLQASAESARLARCSWG